MCGGEGGGAAEGEGVGCRGVCRRGGGVEDGGLEGVFRGLGSRGGWDLERVGGGGGGRGKNFVFDSAY